MARVPEMTFCKPVHPPPPTANLEGLSAVEKAKERFSLERKCAVSQWALSLPRDCSEPQGERQANVISSQNKSLWGSSRSWLDRSGRSARTWRRSHSTTRLRREGGTACRGKASFTISRKAKEHRLQTHRCHGRRCLGKGYP